MHICFQNGRIKKIILRLAVFALCTGVAVCAGEYRTEKPSKSVYNAENSKYLSVFGTASKHNDSKYVAQTSDNMPKMNNDETDYSLQIQGGAQIAETSGETSAETSTETPKSVQEDIKVGKIDMPCADGKISVYLHTQKTAAEMDLEEYVTCCVAAEMPSSFETQALMAQAVAARTFAVRKMLLGAADGHDGAAVCTDYRHCQSYISQEDYLQKGEYAKERLEKIRGAVNATRGVIALYDSQPINAVYHAASGHRTKSSAEVWGGNIPYLVSVAAPEEKSVCGKTYSFDYGTLASKLFSDSLKAAECSSSGKSAFKIEDNEYGSAETLKILGESFDKKTLKRKLGLRSDDFGVTFDENGANFETYGYGHGVGMSQYGADELAKQGKSYLEILKYYYTGIEFGVLY